MILPNVIGIGFPKCGTTFLASCLAEHPDVCFSSKKETKFFMSPDKDKKLLDYEAYFSTYSDQRVIMEWTSSYMNRPSALRLMKDMLGEDVVFVISVRNPIESFKSNYYYFMTVSPGSAATYHNQRYCMENHPAEYVDDFFYDRQFEAFREIFPRSRAILINYDGLSQNVSGLFQTLAEKLEIEPFDSVERMPKVGESMNIRSKILDKVLRRVLTIKYGRSKAAHFYRGPKIERPAYVRAFQALNSRPRVLERGMREALGELYGNSYRRFCAMIEGDVELVGPPINPEL